MSSAAARGVGLRVVLGGASNTEVATAHPLRRDAASQRPRRLAARALQRRGPDSTCGEWTWHARQRRLGRRRKEARTRLCARKAGALEKWGGVGLVDCLGQRLIHFVAAHPLPWRRGRAAACNTVRLSRLTRLQLHGSTRAAHPLHHNGACDSSGSPAAPKRFDSSGSPAAAKRCASSGPSAAQKRFGWSG